MHRRAFLAGAAAMAAVPGCARHADAGLRRRYPPIGAFVDVDGLPVHYWERGSGRPVILLHGASGNLRDWTFDAAPRLARNHRVIAFDRPGFGYSARVPDRGWAPGVQAAHLRAAAAALGAADAVVVGHSLGAAIAMAWGLRYPAEVRGVASVAGATMPWDGDVWWLYDLANSPVGPLVGATVAAAATESLAESQIDEVFAPQPVPAGYVGYIGWPLATRPASFRANARDVAHLSDELAGQAHRYPGLRVPVEILHGTADSTVSPAIHAQAMDALLPSSRLTLLDGLGHMPHHFAYPALAAAIDRLAAG